MAADRLRADHEAGNRCAIRSEPEGILRQDVRELHARLRSDDRRKEGSLAIARLDARRMSRPTSRLDLPRRAQVDPSRIRKLIQFRMYLPVDVDNTCTGRVAREAPKRLRRRATAVPERVHSHWKTLALAGFNDLDIWRVRASRSSIAIDDAWTKEHLFKPDACKVEWRRLASEAQPRHSTRALKFLRGVADAAIPRLDQRVVLEELGDFEQRIVGCSPETGAVNRSEAPFASRCSRRRSRTKM